MNERTERFLEISAALTGFSRVDLRGTGMLEAYVRVVEEAGDLDELLATGESSDVAPDLILLWYCGTWRGQTVSADSYIAGLQWTAAAAHPVGARAQGYGAWAVPPEQTVR